MSKYKKYFGISVIGLAIIIGLFSYKIILSEIGECLVVETLPEHADAIVVLLSGTEWYPRLMEAAALYQEGIAEMVVINGNRKTEVIRNLEKMGFQPCCSWQEEPLRILSLLGVPRSAVITVSAEEAYDTISEAAIVGDTLLQFDLTNIIITTSKYHTRRAYHIWRAMYAGRLSVFCAPAANDPFAPRSWWKDARQIRHVMAEYGAWIFLYMKKIAHYL